MRLTAALCVVIGLCGMIISCATSPNAQSAGKESVVQKKAVEEKPASLPKETEDALLKLLADGKFQEAADKAKEALKTAPKSATANYVLGKSLLSIEGASSREAEDALLISCRVTEWKNAEYIKALADAYEKNGNLDFALEALKKAAQLDPDDAVLLLRMEQLKKKPQ